MTQKSENEKKQIKIEEYKQEEEKLIKILSFADETQLGMVKELIIDAAFISVENKYLREIMAEVGMVKIHNVDKSRQKPLEVTKQYRQNVNTYAVIIKTINNITGANIGEEDDLFDEWIKSKQKEEEEK